jgi:hypothetical protein
LYWVDIWNSLVKTATVAAASVLWAIAVYGLASVGLRGKEGGTGQAGSLALVALVFAALALVFGLITGASRTAAVGQLVPAALGLIGVATMYLITKEKGEVATTSVAVGSFALMLLFGTVLGSYERLRAEAYLEARAYDIRVLQAKAEAEFLINAYRKARGLEPVKIEE